MIKVQAKSAYIIQIVMVLCFNLFILSFFGWFFYLIYSARELNESTGPGMGIAIVAIPIVAILLWVVNYTACGLLTDETHIVFKKGKGPEE
ncbi:MAG: hypothetical protein COT35_10795 [Nitrospirae bacterium CG08_land_8_20_14_0_20_52_24]|nr:MAG: hypothetical protein COT35_10795 [Nitrospirae bacterium CG08_land_8_20_14_0_20_52_24]PIV83240.1 MAG: hypothetical protein COW52_09340 [Nitrospirae bacterium CG17_big_fil_post_rev_8_21_14_2_50_50_9]PIW84398.1 MAG: hypothetical protein COZ95_10035 [Nitrospirae bacterium CG_4_8_14_3_um_filter_50_41]PIX86953.1 MAG: hypothetical protein COZ32_00690 [Nitrospirae bacterium CG_4_10_14_3_um_filter_53_41]